MNVRCRQCGRRDCPYASLTLALNWVLAATIAVTLVAVATVLAMRAGASARDVLPFVLAFVSVNAALVAIRSEEGGIVPAVIAGLSGGTAVALHAGMWGLS